MSTTTMKALMTRLARNPAVYTIPLPTPKLNEILIKVAYVSLNPTDWKHANFALPPSKVVGCEFSGTVVDPNSSSFKKGDRVAGVVHGTKTSHNGGFAEYVAANPTMCFLVPSRVSLKEGCTLTVGWVSSIQALKQRLLKDEKAVADTEDKKDALIIYSATTATGQHAIQWIRIYHPSIYIIALASPQHHDHLRSLGADICFPYNSPTLQSDIRALNKTITKAFDCHSEGFSTLTCAKLLSTPSSDVPKGTVVRLLPPRLAKGKIPEGVEVDWVLAYTAMGEEFRFFFTVMPASKEDHRIASEGIKSLTGLLESGELKPMRNREMPGGLDKGVLAGFEEMKAGRVRGEKVVVRVGED